MAAILTPAEQKIVEASKAANNPGIFLNHFIRNEAGGQLVYPGAKRHAQYQKYWEDTGKPARFAAETAEIPFWVQRKEVDGRVLFFEERGYVPLPWQLDLWRKTQKQLTVIGLAGTGKSLGIGMLAMARCAFYPGFRFLNLAPTQYQSGLMEREINQRIEGTEFRDKFLRKGKAGIRYKPYVQYTFANGSTAEFMNVADNAKNVQSWSGDWINLDEAGLIDSTDEDGNTQLALIMIGLATRMRGERPDGTPRMGLLSMISMAYSNDTLWQYYDQGQDPEFKDRAWSRKVFHIENPYLTPEYIQKIRDNVPPGLEGMWLKGERPPRVGREFSDQILGACWDMGQISEMRKDVNRGEVVDGRSGVVYFSEPRKQGGAYILVGDPGVSAPPARNAPVIMLFDVTDFPRHPARIAAFWWGDGRGKYEPFLQQFDDLCTKYAVPPDYRGYDSTGTQKAIAELAFAQGESAVIPMDFSGSKKQMYLSALKLIMGKGKLKIPYEVWGIRDQLQKYQLPDSKMPQDIVSCLAMGAFLMFPLYLSEYPLDDDPTILHAYEDQLGGLAKAYLRYARSSRPSRYRAR